MSVCQSKTNLIVNYLPQKLTDEQFKQLFQYIGPVSSARIIRDKNTHYSYGFGFVEFLREEDAQQAISMLNGRQIENKRIKVAFSRPHSEDIKQAKLYIKNIPPDHDQEKLEKLFSNYGTIIQCRVLPPSNDSVGRTAFILFDLHEEAKRAMEALSGLVLPGLSTPLEIKFATNKPRRDQQPSQHYNPQLEHGNDRYQRGNSSRYGHQPQRQRYAYENHGGSRPQPYQSHRIPPHNQYHHSVGYGNDSINGSNGGNKRYRMDAAPYNMYYGHQQQKHYPTNRGDSGEATLFVYNIGNNSDHVLSSLFAPYGTIIRCNVVESRGFGFVTMSSKPEAMTAISALNGYKINGKQLQVSIKK